MNLLGNGGYRLVIIACEVHVIELYKSYSKWLKINSVVCLCYFRVRIQYVDLSKDKDLIICFYLS